MCVKQSRGSPVKDSLLYPRIFTLIAREKSAYYITSTSQFKKK